MEKFIMAVAAEKTGDQKEADGLFASVCDDTDKFRTSWDSTHLLSAIAFRKVGKSDEALRLMADWEAARDGGDPVFAWASAIYHGDAAKAAAVLSRMKSSAGGTTWDLGTGERSFSLVMEIISGCIPK
jgi:hypothetical protein